MTDSEWVPLNEFADYEIMNEYPFHIRRRDNKRIVSESTNNTHGYIRVKLNGVYYALHRLIAKQFIDNPDNLPEVDHINHNRTDNHLENLRFVSSSDNSFNKSSHKGVQYEFIDEIPDEAVSFNHYDTKNGRRVFDEGKYYYWFDEDNDEDIFYGKVSDNVYRILHINESKSGKRFIHVCDVNKKNVSIYIDIFKYQYSLIE